MDRRLLKIAGKIKDRKLRSKIIEILENPSIRIGSETFFGIPLDNAPASIRHHHNYPGGFIEHTMALYELSRSLSKIVRTIYRCRVNEDLVLCGVLLHDIFKPVTYAEKEERYILSRLAERIDHLTLATAEMVRRGFPVDAVHVVAASHGRQFGPIGPMTIEALICHLADETEAKLNGETLNAARFIIRELFGKEPKQMSGKDAFSVVKAKVDGDWDEVREYVKRSKLVV